VQHYSVLNIYVETQTVFVNLISKLSQYQVCGKYVHTAFLFITRL